MLSSTAARLAPDTARSCMLHTTPSLCDAINVCQAVQARQCTQGLLQRLAYAGSILAKEQPSMHRRPGTVTQAVMMTPDRG
jgi:hypothetical protein